MKQTSGVFLRIPKSSFFAGLFIAVWIMPFIFGYGFLQIEKQAVKREVSRMFNRSFSADELIWLKFSLHDAHRYLHWEHEAEFSYQQKMYDVAQQYETNDSLFLLCYFDKKETHINRLLAELGLSMPLNQQQKNTFRLLFLQLFAAPPADFPVYLSAIYSDDTLIHTAYTFACIVESGQPDTPPPQRFIFLSC